MNKFLIAGAFLALSTGAFAQNVNKLIKQDDVERVIKTLSADDMQGRGTFTPGIEKAAQFIESEYKKIGLKPMQGDSGYRQNFSMLKTVPIKTDVTINNVAIAADNIAIAGSTAFTWNKLEDAEIVKVAPDQDLRKAYMSALQSDKNMLIIVDPKFEALFKRIHGRSAGGSVAFKDATAKHALVFVLGTFDDVKSFTVNYDVKSQELPLFNVAGVIPGKTKPNEYVVFSGHYDHLGIIAAVKGDSIANGADDDASGILL